MIRYNHVEGGAHSLDLVEAEDFPVIAKANPAYRKTYVYGNKFVKDGSTGSMIHYGGDHSGSTPTSNWGEANFRQGTLYFYNNSAHVTGTASSAPLFQLSTTLERAEVWNNVFVFDSTITYPAMRSNQEVNTAYWVGGGVLNLGKNWINTNWADSDPWHTNTGQLLGQTNMIKGSTSPIDLTTFISVASSAVVDAGQAALSAVSAYPVSYSINSLFQAQVRTVSGSAIDLGATEH